MKGLPATRGESDDKQELAGWSRSRGKLRFIGRPNELACTEILRENRVVRRAYSRPGAPTRIPTRSPRGEREYGQKAAEARQSDVPPRHVLMLPAEGWHLAR